MQAEDVVHGDFHIQYNKSIVILTDLEDVFYGSPRSNAGNHLQNL